MNIYAWILIAVIAECSIGFVIYMVGWIFGYNKCVSEHEKEYQQQHKDDDKVHVSY